MFQTFLLFVSFREKKTKFELGILSASELFLVSKVVAKLQKFKFKLRFFKVTKLFLGPRDFILFSFSFLLCTRIAILISKSSLAMFVLKLGFKKKIGIQNQRQFFFDFFLHLPTTLDIENSSAMMDLNPSLNLGSI